MTSFTCDGCMTSFNKCWSEEEAKKEYESAPWNVPGQDCGMLCDDCFEEFKVWFDSLTPEDHIRIRGESNDAK